MAKVLFFNHTGLVSGAERSLLDLLGSLVAERGETPLLACPVGPLADRAHEGGARVSTVSGTAGSLRLHPVQTPRGLFEMARSAIGLGQIARAERVDLIHANSIRAALVAVAARTIGGPPVVAHVRDVLPRGWTSWLVTTVLTRGCSLVIANSVYTARGFRRRGARRAARVQVVYNPIDLARWSRWSREESRARLGLAPNVAVMLVAGQITPWKGQREAIEVLRIVRAANPDACLLIVGEAKFIGSATRYDNQTYERDVRKAADRLGPGAVTFLGEREDLHELLPGADLVLVPSWEEPFGRVVAEAMAAGTCVIATSVGGPAEFLADGRDGFLLPPQDPETWGQTAAGLLADPGRRASVGKAARLAAARFDPKTHMSAICELHARIAQESGRRTRRSRARR